MQLFDTFETMLETLLSLENLISSLVIILFIQLIFILSVARNTQVLAKATSHPPKKKGPSLLTRLRQRLRPSVKLPKGDDKELHEK